MHGNLNGGALSHDGKLLATWGYYTARPAERGGGAARPCALQVWDVAAGKELGHVNVEGPPVTRAAFAPDGKTLAVASISSLVTLYDLATGRRTATYAALRGTGSVLAFAPDGKTLAAGAGGEGDFAETKVQLWDTAGGRRLGVCEGPPGRLAGLAFPAPGRAVALTHTPEAVLLWEAPSGKVLTPREGHDAGVVSVSYARDGRTLLTAGRDGTLLRWDARGRVAGRSTLRLSDQERQTLLFRRERGVFLPSPDGARALAGWGPSGWLKHYDLRAGRELCTFPFSGTPLFDLPLPVPAALSPDGALLVTAGAGSDQPRTVSVWETASGRELYTLSPTKRAVESQICFAFAPEGKTLAVATGDPTARRRGAADAPYEVVFYDSPAGKKIRSFRGMGPAPAALAFAPDGRRLAVARTGGISVRDAVGGGDVQAVAFPGQVTAGPVFSPDGRTLAAGLVADGNPGDFRVNLWEAATGKLRRSFAGHRGTVNSLAFAPDGRALASGAADTTVLLWDPTGRALLAPGKPVPEPARLWAALASDDAAAAWEAMAGLASAPEAGVPWLRDHLRPAGGKGADPERVARLVADLDSDRFAAREEAVRELGGMGARGLPALRAALKESPSAEARRRIEALVARLEASRLPPDQLRAARAVEVLEWVGTPQARVVLRNLAKGAPLTADAEAALARLRAAGAVRP